MNAEILSRVQFAATSAFHYIFPPISIGLGLMLVLFEWYYLRTGDQFYKNTAKFWVKVFALVFAIGVASGIVLEFQFGTNWSKYSRYTGDIFGSALAAEGVFAFFLESGFLALLVFGWDRVSKRTHFVSTCLVALGAHFSAIWIIVANSWMQTPAGYKIVGSGINERAEITDFWAMVLNPSTVDRLTHTVVGAWMTGAFLVMSISAFYILKNRHLDFAKFSMKLGFAIALLASFLQIFLGHQSAVGVAKNQPSKMAALEGHYQTGPMDLYAFGWVNASTGQVTGLKIPVPGFGSTLLSGSSSTVIKGLDEFAIEDRPPVNMTFQAYHLMVALGFAMAAIVVATGIQMARGKLWESPGLLKILVIAVVFPQLANQSGWMAAEVGRQPWIVFGLLRTKDALSPSVSAGEILTSLILIVSMYLGLLALFIYLLNKRIQAGPDQIDKVSEEVPLLSKGIAQ